MNTIWKYELPIAQEFTIDSPKDNMIVAVRSQYNKPFMLVKIDRNEKQMTKRLFSCFGTGHDIPPIPGKK